MSRALTIQSFGSDRVQDVRMGLLQLFKRAVAFVLIAFSVFGFQVAFAATPVRVVASTAQNNFNSSSVYSAPGTIPLFASAVDGVSTYASITYFSNGTAIGTVNGSAPYFSWTNVPIGSYQITAVATDGNGEENTSAPLSVSVAANVAPTIRIASPVATVPVVLPGNARLNAEVIDTVGSVAKVQFFIDGSLHATVNADNYGAPWEVIWRNPPLGTYTVTAIATDDKGETATAAPVIFVVKNNTAPTVAIVTPASNASFAAPASVALTVNAADSDGRISNVKYYAGATLIGTSVVAPFSFTWSNVPAGSYTITAKATDNNGGVTISAPISIGVGSNAAPTIALGAALITAQAPGTIAMTATASDSDGTVAKVEFFSGTDLLAIVAQAPYVYTWTNVVTGSYSLTARATDNAGAATTSAASAVTVTSGGAQLYYVYSDQINAAREITNAAGAVVWRADTTEPFGANLPNENVAGQGRFIYNQRFPGQYFDAETGLHYNYYRDYDPQSGRYVESDPIGLDGGINTYGYVDANPVSLVDPTGLQVPGWIKPGKLPRYMPPPPGRRAKGEKSKYDDPDDPDWSDDPSKDFKNPNCVIQFVLVC
jgi:RHS repeat-associated protein